MGTFCSLLIWEEGYSSSPTFSDKGIGFQILVCNSFEEIMPCPMKYFCLKGYLRLEMTVIRGLCPHFFLEKSGVAHYSWPQKEHQEHLVDGVEKVRQSLYWEFHGKEWLKQGRQTWLVSADNSNRPWDRACLPIYRSPCSGLVRTGCGDLM